MKKCLFTLLTLAFYLNAFSQKQASNPHAKITDASDMLSWAQDTMELHIPVVVHVIYDFAAPGSTNVSDDQVVQFIDNLNLYFNAANPDLVNIIPTWQPWIGNAHIHFDLTSTDPSNRPSRGIVRHYSYLASGGDISAQIDQWPPDHYLNIYLENYLGSPTPGLGIGYGTIPDAFAGNPYADGVMCRADHAEVNPSIKPIELPYLTGRFLTLLPNLGNPCADDSVDDTPPIATALPHDCGGLGIYAISCTSPYVKSYDSTGYFKRTGIKNGLGGVVDYPDTINAQNLFMQNLNCAGAMITKEQAARVRACLRSAVGMRSSLVDSANLLRTGVIDASGRLATRPDMKPKALMSVSRPFICANGSTTTVFSNKSYNDTVIAATWLFSNGASVPSSLTLQNVVNSFITPGWISASLIVHGNNTGDDTLVRNDLVYVADPTAIDPNGYYQDFNPGGDLDRYPIFNYYGTDHRWALSHAAGVFDNTSICYSNYDTRPSATIANATETPGGCYADFYTPPFDLSGFGPTCNISFFSAGAFRTTDASQMNDTFFVDASADCGLSWQRQGVLTGLQIANNGLVITPLLPTSSQWKEQSIPVNASDRSDHTYFRFRFKTGTDVPTYTGLSFGLGNNFYVDRFRISNAPLGVKNAVIVNPDMIISPNPTTADALVSINGGDNSPASLYVTDLTGKLVFTTSVRRAATTTQIAIPAASLVAKGVYLVKLVTEGATETKKLVAF